MMSFPSFLGSQRTIDSMMVMHPIFCDVQGGHII